MSNKPKNNRQKVVGDGLFMLAINFLLQTKGLVIIPIVIGAVGLESYGLYVQIIVTVSLITPICGLSLGMGFLRFTSVHDNHELDKISREFWSINIASFFLSLLGVSVVFLSSGIISEYTLAGKGLRSLQVSSLYVVSSIIWENLNKYLQSRKRFKLYAVFDFIQTLLPVIGFVIGIYSFKSVYFGMIYYVTAHVLVVLVVFISCLKNIVFVKPSFSIIKKFASFTWALSMSQINGGILSKIDRYFIGYFLGPAAIGIYNIIYQFCLLIDNVSIPFRKYYGSYMPRLWDQGKSNIVKKQIKKGLFIYISISLFLLVNIIFYIDPILRLLLGKTVFQESALKTLVVFIGLGTLSQGANRFYYHIIRCMKKNHYQLYMDSIAALLNSGLNYLLIPKIGLTGAAIATLLGYIIITILSNIIFSINIGRDFIISIIKIGLALLPAIIIGWAVLIDSIGKLIIFPTLGLIGFVLVLYLNNFFLLRPMRDNVRV